MKTYEGLDAQGSVVYFEVSNALFSRRAACKLVSRVPGVLLKTKPKLLISLQTPEQSDTNASEPE